MPRDCLRDTRHTRSDSPNQIPSQQWYAAHPKPYPSSLHHGGSEPPPPPPLTQITAAAQEQSPEHRVAQSCQCPLPEPPAGFISGHLCRPALSLPNLSWRGPRELPENILSGVMFNLDSSPTPSRGSLPCWQKGHPQSFCPTHLCPNLPAGSLQNSTLDSSSPPSQQGKWLTQPHLCTGPGGWGSRKWIYAQFCKAPIGERGLETHSTHRACG